MLRPRVCLALAALAVASCVPSPLWAGDAVKLVPADALGLVVIDRLDDLDAKVGKAATSLGVPLPGPLTALQGVPGLADCLDQESSIVVALLKGAESGGNPVPVAFVPVKDFDAFTKLFGGEAEDDVIRLTVPAKPALTAEKDGFAVIVPDGNKPLLTKVLKSPGGLAKQLGEDLAWIKDRDVAAVMTDAGISLLCQKVSDGIGVAQEAIRMKGDDEMGVAQILNVYKSFFAVVDQEVEFAAVGVNVEESGDLVLRVRKRFLPAGRLAECLVVPAAPGDMLAGLPTEPFIFAAAGQFTPAMGKLMMEYSVEVMKAAPKLYGISEEQAKQMLESSGPIMEDMQSIAMMLAVGSPKDTIYSRMVAVMGCKDSAKYMEAYDKYIQDFSRLMKGSKGIFSMAMESKQVEIEGCKGLEISMEFPEQLLANEPKAQAMIEKMLGPGGKIRVFVVAADKQTVLLGYTNKRLLREALAALRKGESISQEESVKQAAAKLRKGNLCVGYFSPAGLVDFINDMIETLAPEGKKIQLPAFPKTLPIAWAANAEKATVDAQVVVPADAIRAGIGYAAKVRATFNPAEE